MTTKFKIIKDNNNFVISQTNIKTTEYVNNYLN